MKKTMKQFFQKGLSGILCAAMVLTSLSIPEMTAYASQTELTDEVEMTAETNEEITNESDAEGSGSVVSEDISGDEDNDAGTSDSNSDKEDAGDAEGESDTVGAADKVVKSTDVVGAAEVDKLEAEVSEDGETDDNLLTNGDFETIENYNPTNWTIDWSGWLGGNYGSFNARSDGYLDWWVASGTTNQKVSLSQSLSYVTAGKYTLSAEVGGAHASDVISLTAKKSDADADTAPLAEVDLGEGKGWCNWQQVKTVFEITEGDNIDDITVSVEGYLGDTAAENSLQLSNVKLSIEMNLGVLRSLVEKAKTLNENDYTTESWSDFKTAYQTATALLEELKNEDNEYTSESTDIADDYLALFKAMNNLTEEEDAVTVTFNYYVEDTDGKGVGIYQWGDKVSSSAIADWSIWDSTIYEMTETKYTGWYTIDLTFTGDATDDANFQVVVEDRTSSSLFKCGSSDNSDWYSKFFNGDETTYAVKQFGDDYKLYEGESAVTTAMRNVTLYVYRDDGIPVIGAADTLRAVDDSGEISNLEEDFSEDWGKFYVMEEDSQPNWYYLTFSVPSKPTDKLFELYVTADATSSYGTWKEKFIEGSGDGTNVTPVFSGKIYYKNGVFSDSRDITLKMLEELIAEAEAITDQNSYTEASWQTFSTALTAAKAVYEELKDNGDSYTDPSGETKLTNAYNTLKLAKDNLKEKGRTVTFNYYAGNTGGKKVGIYKWCSNNNITPETDSYWAFWDSYAYEMTKTEYPGWYTIDLTFTGSVEDNATFQVVIEGETSEAAFKCGSDSNNAGNSTIYKAIFSGEENTYAIRTFGESTAKLYKGDTEVNTAMRNITLYVYSADATPAIGAGSELITIDESTGT
ncbi:MAG: FIVAR domain-containing protein, partial [Lachnospiraceae bacterium]|nr:FIVAR domain-containing protein [Lachnospiraceae bacterium]